MNTTLPTAYLLVAIVCSSIIYNLFGGLPQCCAQERCALQKLTQHYKHGAQRRALGGETEDEAPPKKSERRRTTQLAPSKCSADSH